MQRLVLASRLPVVTRCGAARGASTQAITTYRDAEKKPELMAPVNGFPAAVLERVVRIAIPTRHTPQTGVNNTKTWKITFDTKERWENSLMGWSSSADPMSNLQVDFDSREAAMEYCERNGLKYYVHEPHQKKPAKPKSYAANFSWSANTRTSTK